MRNDEHTRQNQMRLRTATHQYGLLTAQQMQACGVSRFAVARRVAAGQLDPLLPGVFAISGHPHSFRRDLMGAVLHAGPGSAVSGRSAACLWGLDGFGSTIVEISTTKRKRAPAMMPSGRRIIMHRVDGHLLPEIETVESLPATSVRKTLLDLAGLKHPRTSRALDEALRRRLTTLGNVWLLYENEWIRGRRGVAILRALLQERTPGQAPTHGDLEALFRDILRDFSLPMPIPQLPVPLGPVAVHVDFAYPDAKLAVECDGFAWHADREAFERDRERDIELQARGWTVLRFTWAKLRYEPGYVADQVRHHLSQGRPDRV